MAGDGFGNRFGIDEVILVRLQEGFTLRCDELYLVSLIAQLAGKKMRARANDPRTCAGKCRSCSKEVLALATAGLHGEPAVGAHRNGRLVAQNHPTSGLIRATDHLINPLEHNGSGTRKGYPRPPNAG